jgi:hypothetical protein
VVGSLKQFIFRIFLKLVGNILTIQLSMRSFKNYLACGKPFRISKSQP